jgi:hypothetical protein
MSDRDWVPIGYARFADLSSAVVLATATPTAGTIYTSLVGPNGLKAVPQHAIITINTQAARVRDDGTSPTASEGERVLAGEKIVIDYAPEAIRKFRVIEEAASASMTVRYYI